VRARDLGASPLPVLVDADDGDGGVTNPDPHHPQLRGDRASGFFIEDQQALKRCGHMGGKHVVPVR